MKASSAAKLNNGDQVVHKATDKICVVVSVSAVRKVGAASPYRRLVGNVCLAIIHPTEGYLEVSHKDVM